MTDYMSIILYFLAKNYMDFFAELLNSLDFVIYSSNSALLLATLIIPHLPFFGGWGKVSSDTLMHTDASNRLITASLNYIDHYYHEDLSIQQLAQHAGVTSQHLCRVFREVMHMSPGQHITQRRIQVAQELILTTSLSLSEIAQQTGFTLPGYFSTVFRNCVGISPSEYRNEFNVNRRNE